MLSVTLGIRPSMSNSSSMIITRQGSSGPGRCACRLDRRSEKNSRTRGAMARILSCGGEMKYAVCGLRRKSRKLKSLVSVARSIAGLDQSVSPEVISSDK